MIIYRVNCFNFIKILLLFFLPFSLSANETNWVAPATQESLASQDIERYYPQSEIKKVLAGDTELTTLFRDHTARFEKGVVILIADWHLTQANDKGIDFLRKALNDYGWVTYSVSAGDAPRRNYESLSENENNNREPTLAQYTKADFDAYSLSLTSRFKAMYQQALTHPGFVVVITQGQSGAILMNYFNRDNTEQLDALITLNVFFNDLEKNKRLNSTMATTVWPTLDITYQDNNHWLAKQLTQRKKLARRHHKTNYRQRVLFGTQASSMQHQRLIKEVYGFLSWLGI